MCRQIQERLTLTFGDFCSPALTPHFPSIWYFQNAPEFISWSFLITSSRRHWGWASHYSWESQGWTMDCICQAILETWLRYLKIPLGSKLFLYSFQWPETLPETVILTLLGHFPGVSLVTWPPDDTYFKRKHQNEVGSLRVGTEAGKENVEGSHPKPYFQNWIFHPFRWLQSTFFNWTHLLMTSFHPQSLSATKSCTDKHGTFLSPWVGKSACILKVVWMAKL